MEHNSVFDLNMLKYFQLLIKLILEIENSSNFIFMSINKILLNSSSNCSALHHLWTFESRVEKSPGLLSSEIPHVQEALSTLGPKYFLNRTWALFYVVLYNKKWDTYRLIIFRKSLLFTNSSKNLADFSTQRYCHLQFSSISLIKW